MALSLGMKMGGKVWFNNTVAEIIRVITPTKFKLKVYGSAMDHIYEVDNSSRVEIMPEVFVSAGPAMPSSKGSGVKLVIEAPQRVKIARDKVRQREEADAQAAD